jgi:hypothetical protein
MIKLIDVMWFQIFMCPQSKEKVQIFNFFFKRSKNREEIELQQGTPEVLKKCENLNPQPMKSSKCKNAPISEETAKYTALAVQ